MQVSKSRNKKSKPSRWYEIFSSKWPDFGQNATVSTEGQWVTFSECLKLCSFQLRLVSGNFWAIYRCLSPKIKNPSPVGDIKLFSQIWSKSPKSKSAGGQWENISDHLINCYMLSSRVVWTYGKGFINLWRMSFSCTLLDDRH